MASLIYTAIASLDGYIEDRRGSFDWAEPDEELHGFVDELEREVRPHRRLYEVLVSWEAIPLDDQPGFVRDFAHIWQAAGKIVYSRTLDSVASARTRLERDFGSDAVRRLKASAARDLTIGGPELAAHA